MEIITLLLSIWSFALAFFLGATIASGLQCYLDRKAHGQSWTGRSHCDNCGHKLSFVDLIPVFGYLINKGHCKYCGAEIPKKCLRNEIIGGIISVIVFAVVSFIYLFIFLRIGF